MFSVYRLEGNSWVYIGHYFNRCNADAAAEFQRSIGYQCEVHDHSEFISEGE